MSNPYRSFTIILAAFVVFFGIALSSAAYFLISNQMIQETSEITRSAMERHFAGLPQLSGLFGESSAASTDHAGHEDHVNSTESYEQTDTGNSSYDQLNTTIRTHFDLYQINEVQIYNREGIIQFSYEPARMHTMVSGQEQATFRQTLSNNDMISKRKASYLELWIPIMGTSGQVVGVVEAKRDWTTQKANIWRISSTMALVTAGGMLVLFFGLRQLFLRSSRIIERQTIDLNDMLNRIHRTYDESLQALSSALDSRDNETQGHSYRVTAYSWLLAKQLGVENGALETMIRGALLHDVGKIGIPDHILRKEGPLDDMEWAIMRTHVNMGVRMLEHIDFLKPSLEVVKYHHERWDGTGYPAGIKGNEIPLSARIFAICDTYDAMTSDRPYRAARTHEEAIKELKRCAGTQFCPKSVEAFLRLPEDTLAKVRTLSQQEMQNVSIEAFLPRVG